MLLAEQGKLAPDDDIRKYLTDFPDQGQAVTIAHLLSHTSGVAGYSEAPGYHANMTRNRTVAQMIARFQDALRIQQLRLFSAGRDHREGHRPALRRLPGASRLRAAGHAPYRLRDGSATRFGYGWEIGLLQGSPTVGHAGGISGYAAYVLRLPREKVYVAVLSNSDEGIVSAGLVAIRAAAIAIGKPFQEFKAIALDPGALDAFAGRYRVDAHTERVIFREGRQLYLQRTGSSPFALTSYSATGFFIDGTLTQVQFTLDAQGAVTHLTLSNQGQVQGAPNPRI